jgi:tRNA threonylcarbamoyladenosine biosynthesis protein TsaE
MRRMSEPIRDSMPGVEQCTLKDLSATESLGRRLAGLLRAGDSVLLGGPLGAGKTALARALLRAACADPGLEVPSPSYTLVQSYDAPGFTISHFDLWRLDGPEGLLELGWDEAREGVVLVEWPDRLGPLAPGDALTVRLEPLPDRDNPERRVAALTGWEDRRAGLCP